MDTAVSGSQQAQEDVPRDDATTKYLLLHHKSLDAYERNAPYPTEAG